MVQPSQAQNQGKYDNNGNDDKMSCKYILSIT